MADEALRDDPKFLTLTFSPWRFEGYEDVRTALMVAVIGALYERADLVAWSRLGSASRAGRPTPRSRLVETTDQTNRPPSAMELRRDALSARFGFEADRNNAPP
jgi:hypothetical protein